MPIAANGFETGAEVSEVGGTLDPSFLTSGRAILGNVDGAGTAGVEAEVDLFSSTEPKKLGLLPELLRGLGVGMDANRLVALVAVAGVDAAGLVDGLAKKSAGAVDVAGLGALAKENAGVESLVALFNVAAESLLNENVGGAVVVVEAGGAPSRPSNPPEDDLSLSLPCFFSELALAPKSSLSGLTTAVADFSPVEAADPKVIPPAGKVIAGSEILPRADSSTGGKSSSRAENENTFDEAVC